MRGRRRGRGHGGALCVRDVRTRPWSGNAPCYDLNKQPHQHLRLDVCSWQLGAGCCGCIASVTLYTLALIGLLPVIVVLVVLVVVVLLLLAVLLRVMHR